MSEQFQSRSATNNFILDALPDADYNRLRRSLEPVQLALGEVLYQPQKPLEYAYFPINSMASVITGTLGGQSAEVGVIGNEGIVGIEALMGIDLSTKVVLMQVSDSAFRIKTEDIRKEFKRGGALQDLVLRFIHCFIEQISQTALCNRLHKIEERLARWLLMCRDRAQTDKLALTQEFLAIMLGAQRSDVTRAAVNLQESGFIKYSRGKITIVDRDGLENFSCSCYRVVREVYEKFSSRAL